MTTAPLRVLIPCPGLGIAARGFERFAQDCFEALRTCPDVEVTLVGGRDVPTLPRTSRLARSVAYRTGRHSFWLEQLSFAITVQPRLLRLRPDVVLLSEWTLAAALARLRRPLRQRFRLVLCNGAAGLPPFPAGVDHVQQPAAWLYEAALAAGEPATRHTLLPLGVAIQRDWAAPTGDERQALRARLGLPHDRRVLLSVGVLSAGEKRMDYVLREAARAQRRPFVVLLGERADDTDEILALGGALLGQDGFVARTVAPAEVHDYYRAADAFASASMSEGFPLVLAEALQHGLPVLAHDYPASRFVLAEHGRFADLSRDGALARLLTDAGGPDAERHRSVYERFSWDALAPRYVAMLREVARA